MFENLFDLIAGFGVAWMSFQHQRLKRSSSAIEQTTDILKNCQLYSDKNHAKSDSSIILELNTSRIVRNIFERKLQAVDLKQQPPFSKDGFMKSEVGKSFNLGKLRVELKECSIEEAAITQKAVPIQIVKGNQPQFKSIVLALKENINIILVGKLIVDLDSKQMSLFPLFLIKNKFSQILSWENKHLVLEQCFTHLRQQKYTISSQKLLCLLGFMFVILTRYQTIIKRAKAIRKFICSFFSAGEGIQQLNKISSRVEDKLKCLCGGTMNVILDCGHLTVCSECSEGKGIRRCSLCNKISTTTERIYT